MSDEPDIAEPEPDTIGHASRTAKCHHCAERIHKGFDGWIHDESDREECE